MGRDGNVRECHAIMHAITLGYVKGQFLKKDQSEAGQTFNIALPVY
jgi:hypothetical protein